MIPLVDLKKQYRAIKDEIMVAVKAVFESTNFITGPQVKSFEEGFARMSGAAFGIGTSSGTTALHLALVGLEIGPGDEVITVPNTFIATTEAITQVGAKIVFVDVDEKTYNMDVHKLEKAVTSRTKAVIPVHLYGQPCDIEAISALAKRHNLKVIYDAAQAHLAEFNQQPIGAFGDAVCYSFYPGKNLGAYGDGGLVVTNDRKLADKMRMLSDHGRIEKYEHLMEGYNNRLDEVQAAILNVKLKYLKEWTEKRRENAQRYNQYLKDTDCIVPVCDPRCYHVYHLYVIRVKERDAAKAKLNKEGIGAGIHYPIPLHLQKAYTYLGHKKGDFPVSERASEEILSLPMFAELSKEDIKLIVNSFKKQVLNVS